MRLRAIFCSRMVLPARGGETIRPRWPLPIGVTRSTTRIASSSARCFENKPAIGVQWRQVFEAGLDDASRRANGR